MYATILGNRVIVLSKAYKEYPPSIEGEIPFTVECPESVKLGMLYSADTKTFSEFPSTEVEPVQEYIPSNTELYENQMIIMSALADIAEMQMGVE